MGNKKMIKQAVLTGERALFASEDIRVEDSIFEDGESPLKESRNIELEGCIFKWKYPLWYCKNVIVMNTTWLDTARAGVWYTHNISLKDCSVDGPKNFRRCSRVKLSHVTFMNAQETMWDCSDVTMDRVTVRGDYFAMNCSGMKIKDLDLSGNYSFDGAKDIEICDSRLISKDAFWNSENVTVKNCFISGEYLGWNSKNLTLTDCTIESLQGMCYIDNLVMKNCKLINTTLSFEYSSVDADINSRIDSVKNPSSGRIAAEAIDELIMEENRIDPSLTRIEIKGKA